LSFEGAFKTITDEILTDSHKEHRLAERELPALKNNDLGRPIKVHYYIVHNKHGKSFAAVNHCNK
jgi:hypothetical protein